MQPAESLHVGFKRHLRAEAVSAETVCLISGAGVTALSGPSIDRLAPLLDGTRSLDEIKRDARPYMEAAEVVHFLENLAAAGLIEFRPASDAGQPDPAADAYWSLAGLDPDAAESAVGAARVDVIALGGIDTASVQAMLTASGVATGPSDTTAELSLVLCDDYLDPALADINSEQLRRGRPWLLAKLSGPDPWVGPFFQPGQGPCWACLAKRLEGNRPGEVLVRRLVGSQSRSRPPEASLAPGRALGLATVAMEVTKWLAGLRHPGQQTLGIIDTLGQGQQHHPVARRPQCPECGDPELVAKRVNRPMQFLSRPIAAGDGIGQRALTLQQMMSKYGDLIDPVTGIVGELRRDPGNPGFLHSFHSGRNRAIALSGAREFAGGLPDSNGGKGTTPLEAQVTALCEAVERYCGTRSGDEPAVRASYRELGDAAVHPASCLLFDERQYAGRREWNADCAPFHYVPEAFSEDSVVEWTPVWSMITGGRRLMPTGMLYSTPPGAPRSPAIFADSNGNAAGSCLEDAIIHGFLELVERDAVALWWYNRTRHPLVDPQSFDDSWLAEQPARYRSIKRDVWVLDVTSDLSIPVMAAVSRRLDKPAEDILLGFGAHPDPGVAAQRALGELGQLLPAVIGAKADGSGYESGHQHLRRWWRDATVRDEPYLRPDPLQRVRTAASYNYQPSRTLNLDLVYRAAHNANLDVLVLDQTRHDIGMPVVKVVVPGLRHFWPRLAPGRLFDVPVLLGRKPEPTPYEELNPIPIYL